MMRKPDFVIPGAKWARSDYLRRWWLIPRNNYANIYLHKFGSSDDARACHDHPYFNISIILKGSYREHFHDGTSKIRKRGHIVFRPARTLHRLELLTSTVTTLFLTGPRTRVWGFQTPDEGWLPYTQWEAYLERRKICKEALEDLVKELN